MKLHPWNKNFSWEKTERENYLILNEEQVSDFHKHGFVLLEDVLDLEFLSKVTEDLDAIESSMEDFLRTLPDERLTIAEADAIVFSIHAVTVSEAAREFARHPVFAKIDSDKPIFVKKDSDKPKPKPIKQLVVKILGACPPPEF